MINTLVGVAFLFFFVPFRLYLVWINYKARFRYGLRESSPVWRTLNKKVGILSLFLSFGFSIALILIFSSIMIVIFSVSMEFAFALALFGAIGGTIVNLAVDQKSVEGFEKLCLNCRHKEECYSFHKENCSSLSLNQRLLAAVSAKGPEKQPEQEVQ